MNVQVQNVIIAGGVGLLSGVLLATAVTSGPADDTASAPAPAPTVTKTVETLSTVTVTPEPVTTVVSEVPAICVAAIDEADRMIDITVRMAQFVEGHLLDEGDVWTALSNGDYSVVPTYTEKMGIFTENIAGLTHEVGTLRYTENSAACRTLAGS